MYKRQGQKEHIVQLRPVFQVLALIPANYQEGLTVDGDGLAHRVHKVEEGLLEAAAQDTDVVGVLDVQIGQLPAAGQRIVVAGAVLDVYKRQIR